MGRTTCGRWRSAFSSPTGTSCENGDRRPSSEKPLRCGGPRNGSGCSSRRETEARVGGSPGVPTLKEFASRFLEGYVRANQHKPSGIAAKEAILRLHLLPRFGGRRLDEITTEDVQRLKAALAKKSGKTVNNILSVLNVLLKTAQEWNVIECHRALPMRDQGRAHDDGRSNVSQLRGL